MAGRKQSGEWLFWYSLIVVAAAHAALGYLALPHTPEKHGAIAAETTAISISLEASDILEAIEQSDSAEAAAAGVPSETAEELPDRPEPIEKPQTVGDNAEPQPSPIADETETTDARPEPQSKPEPVVKAEAVPVLESTPEEQPQDRTLELAEAALERAMQAEIQRREEIERQVYREAREQREKLAQEQEKREQREKQRTARSAPSGAGGTSSTNSSSGRVSASTGSIRSYKSLIQARIARNRPATAYTGDVVIELSLSTSGHLKGARVTRSSGNRALDRQALSAVRRAAPFPPAPASVDAGSLNNIEVPFNFQR